jgi:hypothetical protein
MDGLSNNEVIRAYMMRAISPSAAVKIQSKIRKNIVNNGRTNKFSPNHKQNIDL